MGYAVGGDPEQIVRHGQEQIHDGNFWTVSYYFGSISDAAVASILMIPGGKNVHTGFQVKSGGDALVEIFENPTIGANGTQLTPQSNNRANQKNPQISIYRSPTITSALTRIFHNYIIGGGGGNSLGGQDGVIPFEDGKWILDGNNTYLIRATNQAGQAKKFAFSAAFWESGFDKL